MCVASSTKAREKALISRRPRSKTASRRHRRRSFHCLCRSRCAIDQADLQFASSRFADQSTPLPPPFAPPECPPATRRRRRWASLFWRVRCAATAAASLSTWRWFTCCRWASASASAEVRLVVQVYSAKGTRRDTRNEALASGWNERERERESPAVAIYLRKRRRRRRRLQSVSQ